MVLLCSWWRRFYQSFVCKHGKLRWAAGQGDIIGQVIYADQGGPGHPANQGERRRDGSEPGCAPHAEQRHAYSTEQID